MAASGELGPQPQRYQRSYNAGLGAPVTARIRLLSITNNAEGAGIPITNFIDRFSVYEVPLNTGTVTYDPYIAYRHK